MAMENLTEPLKIGTVVKILNSGYRPRESSSFAVPWVQRGREFTASAFARSPGLPTSKFSKISSKPSQRSSESDNLLRYAHVRKESHALLRQAMRTSSWVSHATLTT